MQFRRNKRPAHAAHSDQSCPPNATCERASRTAQVQVLAIGTDPAWKELETAVVSTLAVNGPTPVLTDGHGDRVELTGDDPFEQWADVALSVLGMWV